jgi:hypothetical protein
VRRRLVCRSAKSGLSYTTLCPNNRWAVVRTIVKFIEGKTDSLPGEDRGRVRLANSVSEGRGILSQNQTPSEDTDET